MIASRAKGGHRTRRVLLCEWLSAGGQDSALLAEGRAMRDALLGDLATLAQVETSVVLPAGHPPPPAHGGPRVHVLTAPASGALEDFIVAAARAHDYAWIVAPETRGLLAALARRVAARRWLGCTPDAIALASSKQASLRLLDRHGIATPLALRHATRWLVKPDDGAGGVDLRLHADLGAARADVAARRAVGGVATLEPWVEGTACSLSLLCGAGQATLLGVNRQHVTLDATGRLAVLGVACAALPSSAALADLAQRVYRALPGLRGLVGVDFVQHAQHGAVVIEINPRPTTAVVGLAARLGRSLAAEVLALHAQEYPA